jgi:hypothetical protein
MTPHRTMARMKPADNAVCIISPETERAGRFDS